MLSKESLAFGGISLGATLAVTLTYSHFKEQLSADNIAADLAIIASNRTVSESIISSSGATSACFRNLAGQGSNLNRVVHTIDSDFTRPLETDTYVVLTNEAGKIIPLAVLPAGSNKFGLSHAGYWPSIINQARREEIKAQERVKITLIGTKRVNERLVPTEKVTEFSVITADGC